MKSSNEICELFKRRNLDIEKDLSDYYIKNPRIDLFSIDEIPEFLCSMFERCNGCKKDDNNEPDCPDCLVSKIYKRGGIDLEDCGYAKCESLLISLIRERALFDELYESGYFTDGTFIINLPKDKDGNILYDLIDEIIVAINDKAEELYHLSFQDFPFENEKMKILLGDNKVLIINCSDGFIKQFGFELFTFILWRNKLISKYDKKDINI